MWIWLTVCSACLLGVYDVVKKQSLKKNGVLWVLFCASGLTALFLCPFLSHGSLHDHLSLVLKAVLVSTSWISGLIALKLLPLTTVSTIKASRPMFVVIFSIILFSERLNVLQWMGVALVMTALFLLARASKKEGIKFDISNKGIAAIIISVLSGAASALYDKHILQGLQPMFVQSWGNVYITAIMGICLLVSYLADKEKFQGFSWDWRLVLIAVLITASDAMYFYAVKQPDALLSVISMVRRCSVLITFLFGALLFKEQHIRDKALDMAIMLGGIALLLFGSI